MLRTTDALKTCLKNIFLGKKISRNPLALKSKKGTNIFRETFIFTSSSSAVYKIVTQVSFNL